MDIFGINKSPKQIKRRILERNKRRGKAAEEEEISSDLILHGWSSKRTGKGHDFKQEKFDVWTGRTEQRFKEIKSGNARLSKLQKLNQKKLGKKFVVGRRNPLIY